MHTFHIPEFSGLTDCGKRSVTFLRYNSGQTSIAISQIACRNSADFNWVQGLQRSKLCVRCCPVRGLIVEVYEPETFCGKMRQD